MSWPIHCLVNTVRVSAKVARDIFKAPGADEFFYEVGDVTYDGRLHFNSDHSEHQDYLASCKGIVRVLKKHKVKGRVEFLDIEQGEEPYGSWWCHEFDGKGGYRFLQGRPEIKWVPAAEVET